MRATSGSQAYARTSIWRCQSGPPAYRTHLWTPDGLLLDRRVPTYT